MSSGIILQFFEASNLVAVMLLVMAFMIVFIFQK